MLEDARNAVVPLVQTGRSYSTLFRKIRDADPTWICRRNKETVPDAEFLADHIAGNLYHWFRLYCACSYPRSVTGITALNCIRHTRVNLWLSTNSRPGLCWLWQGLACPCRRKAWLAGKIAIDYGCTSTALERRAMIFEQYMKTHFMIKGAASGALLSSKSVLISTVWFGGTSTCVSKVW